MRASCTRLVGWRLVGWSVIAVSSRRARGGRASPVGRAGHGTGTGSGRCRGCVHRDAAFVSRVETRRTGCSSRTAGPDVEWAETLRRITAFVTNRTGDPELAADITQDVVVRSIASGALERVDDVTAWLYRSARNAVIDHHRARRPAGPLPDGRPVARPGRLDRGPERAQRGDPGAGPLPPAAARPAAAGVPRRPDPGRPRGPDPPAGGRRLGISVSGMKSRVQRARRRLRELVTPAAASRWTTRER